jgi:hypothetical protein
MTSSLHSLSAKRDRAIDVVRQLLLALPAIPVNTSTK